MSDHTDKNGGNPFVEIVQAASDAMDLSTDLTVDEFLNGEPARHFPEKRNRRKEDRDPAVIARLHSALEAIDRGEIYTGENNEDRHLMEDCYRQF